jgi:hypothetical protein
METHSLCREHVLNVLAVSPFQDRVGYPGQYSWIGFTKTDLQRFLQRGLRSRDFVVSRRPQDPISVPRRQDNMLPICAPPLTIKIFGLCPFIAMFY